MESLPKIIRDEIEFPLFKNSGKQIDVLNKISAMLGVKFEDEDEDRQTIAIEWVNFVSQYKLTAPEIIEAYNKALRRELRNEKNEVIRLFPNLSLISAGEILTSFIEFKKTSKDYERGENQLKKLLNPETHETEEQREIRIENTLKRIEEMIRAGQESKIDFGFVVFQDLFDAGKLKDVLPTKQELHKNQQIKMKKLLARERKKPMFFTPKELKEMKGLKILPVHNFVRMQIRDEIVVKYVKTFLK